MIPRSDNDVSKRGCQRAVGRLVKSVKKLSWSANFVRILVPGMLVLSMPVKAKVVPEKLDPDDRIGICTHFSQNWSVDEIMPLIARSGAGWIRDDLGWGGLEPTPGHYQIPLKTKVWIHAARRAGLKVDLILTFGNPAYADHYDTDAYAKAAGWLAREVGNDVQAIEILNEPNNFGFRTTYGGAWNGNEPNGSVSPYVQKYVQLLNAAAQEIKLANPQMTVIGLGAPPPASFRMIALGLASQVDGLTDHPYGVQMPELIPYAATPEMLRRDGLATADVKGTFISQVSMFRAQAKKWGATEKLWHTEWGYATVSAKPDKHKLGVSEEMQAVYILRRLLESEAIGVEHTFIYDFKDDGLDPYLDYDNFGLVKYDRSPKQAFFALQRVTGLLTGLTAASIDQQASVENDGILEKGSLGHRCYTFSSADGKRTVVAFWEAKPYEPTASNVNAVVTLPASLGASPVFLNKLLSGEQTELPAKQSDDHRLSVSVSFSSVPQLLIIR
jgi:hypothetical protein